MMKVCMHCGRPESEHHEFEAAIEMPAGCKCPPSDWGDDVWAVCGEYQDDGEHERCPTCEHDKACHVR